MGARVFLFGLFLLGLGALAHAQVGLWALGAFPRLKKHARPLKIVLAALTVLGPLTRVAVARLHGEWITVIFVMAMIEYMVVIFAALPIALIRIATDLSARVAKRLSVGSSVGVDVGVGVDVSAGVGVDVGSSADVGVPAMTRRQLVEGIGGGLVLAASGCSLGWGAARGRHAFVIEEVPVRIVGLPKALDGYVIGQISDLHVGASVGAREIAEGLARLAEIKADLVVCTGDLVDFDPTYIPLLARSIGAIRARDGIAAILGNHDYYTGARAITEALRAAGIDVLTNDGRVIRAGDGGGFALLGVDDLWAGRSGGAGPRLDLALRTVPPDLPRVLLSHQPPSLDAWAGRVALQLSGHTHGGQINPGFRPADALMRYVSGRYEVGGTTLWVNRGFGVAGPPARLGAPPEVTKIVLVAA
jgi:predicted MPP superfamily phosphohydrolase